MASRTPSVQSQADSQPRDNDDSSAYHDTTGALDVYQDGLSSDTQVGSQSDSCSIVVNWAYQDIGDGRVDIRIHETDTQLANQIQQLRLTAATDEFGTPPTNLNSIPAKRPPPLNIVIHVVGSRGDVQPFVALGRELKNNYGHRIRLATHGTFKKFVEENGLEFFDIGGDPAELMAFMVKNPGLIPGMKSLRDGDVGKRQKGMAEILQGCWRSCADADEAKGDDDSPSTARPFIANAIIANPPSFAHIHCAQKLGIPLHLMFTYV